MPLTVHGQEDCIHVSCVPWLRAPAPQPVGVVLSKLLTPWADGCVGHRHPAFEQQFLPIVVAQSEAIREPDPMADNFLRTAVVLVGLRVGRWSHRRGPRPPPRDRASADRPATRPAREGPKNAGTFGPRRPIMRTKACSKRRSGDTAGRPRPRVGGAGLGRPSTRLTLVTSKDACCTIGHLRTRWWGAPLGYGGSRARESSGAAQDL